MTSSAISTQSFDLPIECALICRPSTRDVSGEYTAAERVRPYVKELGCVTLFALTARYSVGGDAHARGPAVRPGCSMVAKPLFLLNLLDNLLVHCRRRPDTVIKTSLSSDYCSFDSRSSAVEFALGRILMF